LERPKEITDLKIHIGNCIYRMGIGGLHSSEECMSLKSSDEFELIDRDVASFYPRILLNLGLHPTHIGPEFNTVYNSIVERRLAAKKAKNLAISECLKITINGTFGKTGSPYSFLYAPEMTIQITVGGQLYLLMLIEALELAGFPIASANTDGIIIKCPIGQKDRMEEVIKMWEKQTGFETEETKYDAIYSRDVNAYLAIKRDKEGKIEFKGKNIYYDPWNGKTAKDKYWRFQKNPNAQICVEAIEQLIAKDIPIEQTIKNSKDITRFVIVKNVKSPGAHQDGYYLGKVIRWYWAKNELKTINYIESGNKVPDSEGGKPVMDLPETFPNDIDYDKYVKRTNELLYEMAYYDKPKQISFF
jgi:DNA polymerase elongation subunit (family B)